MKYRCLLILCILLTAAMWMPPALAGQAEDGYAGSTMRGINWEDDGLPDESEPAPRSTQVSWQNPVCLPFRRSAYVAVQFCSPQYGNLTDYHLCVWDATGALVAAQDDTLTGSRNSLNIWYDIYSDTGALLDEGASYTYQMWVTFSGVRYLSPVYRLTAASGQERHLGVDVSHHNGSINWDIAAQHIDFAILRCGYGGNSAAQDDREWLRNVAACERLGIPYGVYLYSYAESETAAEEEARHVLRLLNGHSPTLPVYYDLEDTKTVATLSNAQIVQQATVFCGLIEQAGYAAGIYSNNNWWTNRLYSLSIEPDRVWFAAWSNKYAGKALSYGLWQFTDGGQIPGIGTVDLNYCPVFSFAVPEPSYTELPADFTLPGSLSEIGEEAFRGCSFTAVRIASAARIGSLAFADCVNLRQIEIPASVTEIADDAFEGCGDVVVLCPEGSAADQFASSHGMTAVNRE